MEPAIFRDSETAIIWSARHFFRGPDSRSILDSQRRRMRKQDKNRVLLSRKALKALRLRRWSRVHRDLFKDLLRRVEAAEKEINSIAMKKDIIA